MTTAHDQIHFRRMSDVELEAAIVATGLITIGGNWPALEQRHDYMTGGCTTCYTARISGDETEEPLYWLRCDHPEHDALLDEMVRRWPDRMMLTIDWGDRVRLDSYLQPAPLPANIQAVIDAAFAADENSRAASEAADVAEARAKKLQQEAVVAAKQARDARALAIQAGDIARVAYAAVVQARRAASQ